MKKRILLVGLGGTGCDVVSRVKAMVEQAEKTYGKDDSINLQYIGFDTDTNRDGSPDLDVLQTSSDRTVRGLLQDEKGWQKWFPYNPVLLEKSMKDGAGQLRFLSRLAFSDKLVNGDNRNLVLLRKAVDALIYNDGEEMDMPRIMVVSSFAGGTGSGMFLQMGMFLRNYIDSLSSGTHVIIRGLFALPDLFVDAPGVDKSQRESMYANAYACLKEFSLINRIYLTQDEKLSRYNIQIGDVFDSKKIISNNLGLPDLDDSKSGAWGRPYDFIFFMDNINQDGLKLSGGLNAYKDEMAKITYLQVYGPLTEKNESNEDNLIYKKIQSRAEAIYGSAGSSKIIYPYHDILSYCSYRMANEVISEKWMAIDKLFKEKLAGEKKRRKKDMTVELPVLREEYIRTVDEFLDPENPNYHFSFLESGIKLKESEDNISDDDEDNSRVGRYWDDMNDYITGVYKKNKFLNSLYPSTTNIDEVPTNGEDAQEIIKGMESSLIAYKKGVDKEVGRQHRSIAMAIFPNELDGIYDVKGNQNIRELLELKENGNSHAVHPMAIRYLLYKLSAKISEEKADCEKIARELDKKIKDFHGDLDNNKDGIQKWVDYIPKKDRNIKKWWPNFKTAATTQIEDIKKYGENKLCYLVYEDLLECVDQLAKEYETLFDNLTNVTNRMEAQKDKLSNIFTQEGSTDIYLYCSPQSLNEIYDSVKELGNNAEQEENNGIFDKIFAELYSWAEIHRQVKAANNNYNGEQFDEDIKSRINDLFEECILPYYQKEIANNSHGKLDFSVYEALEKQALLDAKLKDKNPDKKKIQAELSRILAKAYNKAAPLLYYNEHHAVVTGSTTTGGKTDANDTPYWGISNKVYNDIGIMLGNENQIAAHLTPYNCPELTVAKSSMYSNYELQCYRALYNVRLTEIPKFNESEENPGDYYKNYKQRITEMLEGENEAGTNLGLTPHLDMRWHSSEYLPMINPVYEKKAKQKSARAMWLAYFYGAILEMNNTKGKKELWIQFITEKNQYPRRQLFSDGQPLKYKKYAYLIYKAIQQDTVIRDRLLEVLDPVLAEDCINRSTNYNFRGRMINPLIDSMIGKTKYDIDYWKSLENPDQDEELEEYIVNESFNTNALGILFMILHDPLVPVEDIDILIEELMKIIEQFCADKLEDREEALKEAIFNNSPFITKNNRRRANAQVLIIDRYFSEACEAYDKSKERKPAAVKTVTAAVKSKKTPAKSTAAKATKTAVKKTTTKGKKSSNP